MPVFAMQLTGFSPGAKLEIVNGSFRGIGFGGTANIIKFDGDAFELDLRVTKLLFHINVKLRFHPPDANGKVEFFGGRPDGQKTGSEPAHVKHTMTITSQTHERTVFEFEMIEKDVPVKKKLSVEKTRVKGSDALRFVYDRYELTLAPKR
jgi:hypothetical protein